jgi:hypothetical protein
MARRLKVFCWSDGLHAYTVATSSRAKALAAWGFNRDLFRDGEAREIKEGADHDRALAAPGVTVKRGLGTDAGDVEALKPAKPKREPARPSRADMARVARLEADLAALAADRDARRAAIERQRQTLAQDEARLSSTFEARRCLAKNFRPPRRSCGRTEAAESARPLRAGANFAIENLCGAAA